MDPGRTHPASSPPQLPRRIPREITRLIAAPASQRTSAKVRMLLRAAAAEGTTVAAGEREDAE